jgi:MYXO-CTERM domain-containing protein
MGIRRSWIGISVAAWLGSAAAGAAVFQAVGGQVGYWRLDQNASPSLDTAGTANGTWIGNPTFVTTGLPPGLSYANPGALQFDGVDDGVQIANTPALENVQEGSYTLSVWFKPLALPDGLSVDTDNGALIAKTGWHEGITYTSEGRFVFHHWTANDYNLDMATPDWIGTGTWATTYPPNGGWYHVAAVWDAAAGEARIYVDGASIMTTAFAPNLPNREFATSSWHLGIANPVAGTNVYRWAVNGVLDDARIYNRALGTAEIQELEAGLPAPSGMNAAGGVLQTVLTWNAPAGFVGAGAYAYNVFRRTGGGAWTQIGTTAAGVTTFTDTTGAPGTTYDYAVTALSVGESGYSNVSSAASVNPAPRTNDHDEGLFDGKCSCGTATPQAPLLAAALAAALAFALRRKR